MQTRLHRVRQRRDLGGGSFALEIDGPIPPTGAGQFFMLRTPERWPVLLPRPFSLYDRGADGEWGSFLIKGVGPGTNALLDVDPGEEIVATGPLGRTFPTDVADPVCIAGGVGLAPFLLLARAAAQRGERLRLLFGGRDRGALAGLEDFEPIARVWTSTDDGSHGHHGLVTALLTELLARGEVAAGNTVFCCGPDPMMHAVAALCDDGHDGELYEVTGPRLLTFADAVAAIARASGRELDYLPISLDDFRTALATSATDAAR